MIRCLTPMLYQRKYPPLGPSILPLIWPQAPQRPEELVDDSEVVPPAEADVASPGNGLIELQAE